MDPQPPSAPPPWPPPLAPTQPRLDASNPWTPEPAVRSYQPAPRRRWPVASLVIAALLLAMAGVALGAAGSTASAASTAAQLEAAGDFAAAIAVDEVIEGRTGPLFILDTSAASTATAAEEHTLMAWARFLGRKGEVDEAVVLYRSVTDRSLRPEATAALATLLYSSSTSDAAHQAYPAAIARTRGDHRAGPEHRDRSAGATATPDRPGRRGSRAHRRGPRDRRRDGPRPGGG